MAEPPRQWPSAVTLLQACRDTLGIEAGPKWIGMRSDPNKMDSWNGIMICTLLRMYYTRHIFIHIIYIYIIYIYIYCVCVYILYDIYILWYIYGIIYIWCIYILYDIYIYMVSIYIYMYDRYVYIYRWDKPLKGLAKGLWTIYYWGFHQALRKLTRVHLWGVDWISMICILW